MLLELVNFRFGPHTMAGDEPLRYRTSALEESWKCKDPITRFRKFLTEKGLWNASLEEETLNLAKELVSEEVKITDSTPKQRVTDLMEIMYEEMPSNLKEQYEERN
jgi:pyruvate dehydrogenase E1 component alpha subunit